MNFTNAIKSELNKEISITENGAIGYKTSGDLMVDFNFAVSSMRKWTSQKIYNEFVKFFVDNKSTALRYLFYLRDREQGIGERETFRTILRGLAVDYPEYIRKVLKFVPQFGRWDDLWCLMDTDMAEDMLTLVAYQLAEDKRCMDAGKSISLLAKWMPSINTSSKETVRLAREMAKEFGLTEKEYRKALSSLRSYLEVIEVKMSANQWDEIDYNAVPSKANVLYKTAFFKHDEERRRAYLDSLARNDGAAKINAGVLFPHDVVHSYVKGLDATLEALWENLPNYVKDNSNTLVIRDGSYSMTCKVDNKASTSALEVATALTIYFSEKESGEFKDKFITFSAKPKFIDLGACKTLHDKLVKCYAEDDCSNTNIEATFDLILNAAIRNGLKQENLPDNVLIISDMEFDATCNRNGGFTTLFDGIRRKFQAAGYRLPKLIFWNVNSRTNTVPLQRNDAGVILVSGFSTAICNMVLSNELDPLKALLGVINAERYDCIAKALEA